MTTQDELEKNWEAFNKMELSETDIGRAALLHDGKLISIFNDRGDAYNVGREKYGLGNFSVEIIGSSPQSLGYFTAFVPGA